MLFSITGACVPPLTHFSNPCWERVALPWGCRVSSLAPLVATTRCLHLLQTPPTPFWAPLHRVELDTGMPMALHHEALWPAWLQGAELTWGAEGLGEQGLLTCTAQRGSWYSGGTSYLPVCAHCLSSPGTGTGEMSLALCSRSSMTCVTRCPWDGACRLEPLCQPP